MIGDWSLTALLVHGAALTYVIGFLVRDQLVLRGLLQIGSILYIAYYYFEPATPLWDAIAWTTVMFLANAWTIGRILSDRRKGSFDEEDLVIHGAIPNIAPGDFRRLLAKAEKETASDHAQLTREGAAPDDLWFVISGTVTIDKTSGANLTLPAPMFIGEIAYLLDQPASASVVALSGTRLARWSVTDLRALVARSDSLKVAMESAFNRDLAAKVMGS